MKLTEKQIETLKRLGFLGKHPYIKSDNHFSIHQFTKGHKVFALGDGTFSQFRRIKENEYPEWVKLILSELRKEGIE